MVRRFCGDKDEGGGRRCSWKVTEIVSVSCALWDPLVAVYLCHHLPEDVEKHRYASLEEGEGDNGSLRDGCLRC